MKTISDLNKKWWYRLIKVIYLTSIIAFVIFLLASIVVDSINEFHTYFIGLIILWLIAAYLVAEFLRKTFYYIVLGKIRPPRE